MCEAPLGGTGPGEGSQGSVSLGPLELSNLLHGLPCTLTFNRSDKMSIMQLIALARHHLQGVRHTFLLLLMLQLSLVVLQMLDAMLLPPVLAPRHVMWLAVVALPALCVTMNTNPPDQDIMKKALGKNIDHLSTQVVLEFLFYFSVGCVPTIIVCLITHAITLNAFCQHVAVLTNATCHMLYGQSGFDTPGQWNGWASDHSVGLALSQNIVTFQFLLNAGCASLCFIHRYHHLWQRSPFVNRAWCVVTPLILIIHLIYFIVDFRVHDPARVQGFTLSDIPVVTPVLVFVWPLVMIGIQELIKRRERKLSVRYQKRARLDFGTKLGMNSPF